MCFDPNKQTQQGPSSPSEIIQLENSSFFFLFFSRQYEKSGLLNTQFKETAIFDHQVRVHSVHTCVCPPLTFNSTPLEFPPCRSRVSEGGKVLNRPIALPVALKKLPKAQ